MITFRKFLQALGVLSLLVLVAAWQQGNFPPGSGLPTGLTFVSPTLTVSSAGNGNGCVALSGTTSGTSTLCASAVAGTSTNPVTMSNGLLGPNGSAVSPTYGFTNSSGVGMYYTGTYLGIDGTSSGVFMSTGGSTWVLFGPTTVTTNSTALSWGPLGPVNSTAYSTGSNCASAASPAVCGSAAAGDVAVPTGATPTLQINTTAVTANSEIQLTVTEAATVGTRLSATCNSTLSTLVNPVETARVAGASFTIQMSSTLAVNPACIHYSIIN